MARITTRAFVPAGLITVLAVGLTACGGSESTLGASASATASATSTARPVATVGSTVSGNEVVARLTAGITASPGATVAADMLTGGERLVVKGSVDVATAGSALALDVDSVPQEGLFKLIELPGTRYLDLSSDTASAGGVEAWIKITGAGGESGSLSGDVGGLAALVSSAVSPDSLLRLTEALPTMTVKTAGAKGVTYTAELTLGQAVQVFPLDLFDGDEAARAGAVATETDVVGDVALVVDAEGRPVSFTYRAEVEGDVVKITTTYSRWGAATGIKAPPAATVVDAAKVDATGAS